MKTSIIAQESGSHATWLDPKSKIMLCPLKALSKVKV